MKGLLRTVCLLAALAAAAAIAMAVMRRDGSRKPSAAHRRPYGPVAAAVACISLAEKPDAGSVLLAGAGAEEFSNAFARVGLKCGTERGARYDAVFAAHGAADFAEWRSLGKSLSPDGIAVWRIDADRLPAKTFEAALRGFPFEECHLWMPGERDWILVGRARQAKVKFDAVADLFARECAFEAFAYAGCNSMQDLFANYIGAREDLLPAFNGSDADVRPGDFVSRDPPALDWVDVSEVDADMAEGSGAAVKSARAARLLVVQGMLAAERGDADESVGLWAKANRANHGDTMLRERMHRLRVNAEALAGMGKYEMAAECLNTILAVRDDDVPAALRLGECLKLAGKRELAEKVVAKARSIEKGKEASRAAAAR